jgi:hypothetical protein
VFSPTPRTHLAFLFQPIHPTSSQQTIQPTAALPAITDPIIIDGWSQGGAGYTGPPLIDLDGASARSSVKALHITSGNSVVRGLVINGYTGSLAAGIYQHTGGTKRPHRCAGYHAGIAARWNNPAAYDPTYDVAPPFGNPIDIPDIIAIAEQWDSHASKPQGPGRIAVLGCQSLRISRLEGSGASISYDKKHKNR